MLQMLAGSLPPPCTLVSFQGLARSQALVNLLGCKNAPEPVASATLDPADWLGLTFETVSHCRTRLKKAGLIDIRQGDLVTLLDPQKLSGIAAGDRPLSP